MITIRTSLLPSYFDCPRRAAAKILEYLLHCHGYDLRTEPPLISGNVGTAVHDAQGMALIEKAHGRPYNKTACVDYGIEMLRGRIADGVEYDETTANFDHATKQVQIISNALFAEVLPGIDPVIDRDGKPTVEYFRKATICDGFELTGHLDYETTLRDIGDTKTGKSGTGYDAQLGGYSLLRQAHEGQGARVVFIEHAPRVSIKKPFPGIERYPYDVRICELAARYTVERIVKDICAYQKTQIPWVFPCNQMSQLCSPKYCTAYGTDWCELTKKNIEEA
jgi:hypothetical protein